MNLYGSSMTGSAVRPTNPRGVVRLTSNNDSLAHYGIPGQKWGVITKEYEPVAVDKRKLRESSPASTNTFNKSFRPPDHRKQTLTPEKSKAGWVSNKAAKNNQRMKKAAIVGAVAIGLLLAYGTYKYVKVTKANAYAGTLKRFLSQNPDANIGTESGRQLLQKGLNQAKMNSRRFYTARNTNAYLKRIGSGVKYSESRGVYSARNLMSRCANIKTSGSRLTRSVNSFRRARLQNKILGKLRIT